MLLPFKQRGLAYFPITNRGSLSVLSWLQAMRTVTCSSLFFPPLHVWPLKWSVWVGVAFHKRPVLSALNQSLGLYLQQMSGRRSSHVLSMPASTLFSSPQIFWPVRPCLSLKQSRNPTLALKSLQLSCSAKYSTRLFLPKADHQLEYM